MVKNTVSESAASEIEKKKKRPWRNKVRKQAQKKAAQEAREKAAPEFALPTDPTAKKKKKRSKKKKFIANEEAEEAVSQQNKEEEQPLSEIEEAKKKLDAGRFRYLNEQLYTMSGSDALDFFKEDPDSFWCYHKGFADQVKKWPNHPLQAIVGWLSKMKDRKVVYDLGCGEAKIAEAIKDQHEVSSFDLVAVNDRVTACDMAHLPREAGSADVVIFCLSLMGTNTHDFIKEARRVLRDGGILKIAEVTSRFVNVKLFCEAICKMGFTIGEKRELSDYFLMMQFTKIAKVENKRPFGLKLKPCLYKKR